MIIFGIRALFWELRNVRYVSLLDPLLFSVAYYVRNLLLYHSFISRASSASPPPPPPGWVAFERNVVEPNNKFLSRVTPAWSTWPIPVPSDYKWETIWLCPFIGYLILQGNKKCLE